MTICAVGRLKHPRCSSLCSYHPLSPGFEVRPYLRQDRRLLSHRRGGPPEHGLDPRLEDLGQLIEDDYAVIREQYCKCANSSVLHRPWIVIVVPEIAASPRHPIVLAHGLLGFDELRLAGPYFPGIQYWRGIREALTAKGIDVVTTSVSPSASIEERAKELESCITEDAGGKDVNIIAYVVLDFSVQMREDDHQSNIR